MSSHPRVLVIPSWYPTKTNPLIGTFFQEQAALLREQFDVRVLFGIGRPVKYLDAVRQLGWFPRRGRAKVLPKDSSFFGTPPPVIGFDYHYHSIDEIALLDAAVDGYRQAFQKIIADGWKPDLLHAHCADFAGIIAAALARECGIPWVLTEHSIFVLANYSEYRRKLMVEAVNAASTVVAVSHYQKRCIFVHNIHRPIEVVGNLIDEEFFPLKAPVKDPTRFRILTVTYPSPIKDCETFFRALAVLLERGHSDIEAVVIGNNSFDDLSRANTQELERMAAKYQVQQVCRFIAHVSREEMPRYYAECEVFVSTSIAETFGVSVREAMSAGRPVVCTASGGLDDMVSSVNGVEVNISDHEGIADGLAAIKTGRLTFRPEDIRKSVVERHGRVSFLKQMIQIYQTAMNTNLVLES